MGKRVAQAPPFNIRFAFDPDGRGVPTELLDLQPELRLAVLSFLPSLSLCRVGATCSAVGRAEQRRQTALTNMFWTVEAWKYSRSSVSARSGRPLLPPTVGTTCSAGRWVSLRRHTAVQYPGSILMCTNLIWAIGASAMEIGLLASFTFPCLVLPINCSRPRHPDPELHIRPKKLAGPPRAGCGRLALVRPLHRFLRRKTASGYGGGCHGGCYQRLLARLIRLLLRALLRRSLLRLLGRPRVVSLRPRPFVLPRAGRLRASPN